MGKNMLIDALKQCKYPPDLVEGKSVWSGIFIDELGYLCFAGHEKYIQTIDVNMISDVFFDDQDIFILAQQKNKKIIIAFFCSDCGIRSISWRIYGHFSVCLSEENDPHRFVSKNRDMWIQNFEHIDLDREEDIIRVATLLNEWKGNSDEIIVRNVPDTNDQVLQLLNDWEDLEEITKEECFERIYKLMTDNGIKYLEHAVDFDIAEYYIDCLEEYLHMLPTKNGEKTDLQSHENKCALDAGEITVDELSLEELDAVEKLYINEINQIAREIERERAEYERLRAENERLRALLGKSKND